MCARSFFVQFKHTFVPIFSLLLQFVLKMWAVLVLLILASSSVFGDLPLCVYTRDHPMMSRLNKTLETPINGKLATMCRSSSTSDQSGTLISPNYPERYDNNLDCYFYILTPSGYQITLVIDFFSMQTDYDYFTIYDSHDTTNWQQETA